MTKKLEQKIFFYLTRFSTGTKWLQTKLNVFLGFFVRCANKLFFLTCFLWVYTRSILGKYDVFRVLRLRRCHLCEAKSHSVRGSILQQLFLGLLADTETKMPVYDEDTQEGCDGKVCTRRRHELHETLVVEW